MLKNNSFLQMLLVNLLQPSFLYLEFLLSELSLNTEDIGWNEICNEWGQCTWFALTASRNSSNSLILPPASSYTACPPNSEEFCAISHDHIGHNSACSLEWLVWGLFMCTSFLIGKRTHTCTLPTDSLIKKEKKNAWGKGLCSAMEEE